MSWVSIVEFDPFDRTQYIARTAVVEDELIERVLAGTRPPQEPEAAITPWRQKPERPKGARDLAWPAATASGLPDRFELIWEGYAPVGGEFYAFNRVFADQPFAKLTGLPLSVVVVNIYELIDPKALSEGLDALRTQAGDELVTSIAANLGQSIILVDRVPVAHGDDGLTVILRSEDPLMGSYHQGMVTVAHGDLVMQVLITGPGRH